MIDNSPQVLSQTLIEIGRLMAELQERLEGEMYTRQRAEENEKKISEEAQKYKREYASLFERFRQQEELTNELFFRNADLQAQLDFKAKPFKKQ